MSVARDISRQTSRQTATLTAGQTAVTVTGGFSSSTVEVYLNGAKLIQGSDYSLNGTSGITLTQGASAGDIIEFAIRNSSNSGLSAVNTSEVVDGAVTSSKLSTSATESDNVKKRVAFAWVRFDGSLAAGSMILESYNIDSITDDGQGNYKANFTVNPSNANYCSVVSNDGNTSTYHTVAFVGATGSVGGDENTSSSVDIVCINITNSNLRADCDVHLVVFA